MRSTSSAADHAVPEQKSSNSHGVESPNPPAWARTSSCAVCSSNGAEYNLFCAHPPPWRPPTNSITAELLTHGAPLTSPSHANEGNPLSVIPVLASQPIGMLPTAKGYPVTQTRLSRAGAVPSESAEPTCDSIAPLTRAIT